MTAPWDPDGRREAHVLDAVSTLVDSLLHDFDVVELLTQLSESSVALLNVASAGLLLADPTRRLHLVAATSDAARELELFQLQADEGPCLDCFASGSRVTVPDLREHSDRWPRFVDEATGAGFASVHAVPMRAAGLVLGALGLFGTSIGGLDEADLALGQTLAHIASVAIMQEHGPNPATVFPHLRGALVSRIVVEQAKGFLRARLDVTTDEAFELLRRYAVAHRTHLTDVARSLVSDRSSRPAILQELTELLGERRSDPH